MDAIERELRTTGTYVPELTGTEKEAVIVPLHNGGCLLLPSLGEMLHIVVTYLVDAKRQAQQRLQRQGIEAAKARGVRFGRTPIVPDKSFQKAYELWRNGSINTTEAARMCGMCRSTFHVKAKAEKRQAAVQNSGQ